MEKQAEVVQAPPPYTEQSGYPPQPANPPPQQPGYQPQPAYPPQGQPGYPPQGQPGYQQGYPPQGQQGYPPQGYPQQGYPPPAQPAYPVYQQPAPTVIAPVQQISNNVTVVQANAPQTIVAQVYPPDHCTLAWFACLCCFCPLGICAIYNASNTRDAIDRGDIDAAYHSSMMARKYANLSIGIGILWIIVVIIVNVVS